MPGSEPGSFPQGGVHSSLPAFAALTEFRDDILVNAQCDLLLGMFDRWPAACAPVLVHCIEKCLGQNVLRGTHGGKFFVRQWW